MKKILHLLILQFVTTVVCQKWTSPQDRKAYVLEDGELEVTWSFEAQEFELFYAQWHLANPDNTPNKTLIAVNKANAITIYSDQVESPTLGEIKFLKLDKKVFKKIKASIILNNKNDDNSVTLEDTLDFEYVDIPPYFTSASTLQAKLQVREGSTESKNQVLTITSEGKPRPKISWKLNDVLITDSSLPGFTVTESTSTNLNLEVVTSELTISSLEPKHNGRLTVTTHYGDDENLSPKEMQSMDIDVQYPPRSLNFSTNLTTRSIINEGSIAFTCASDANPKPIYILKEVNKVWYESQAEENSIYLPKNHHTLFPSFQCIANNSLGVLKSPDITIRILNGTFTERQTDDDDTKWWVYYAVGVGVGCVIFIGVAVTMLIIRSRMRSMDIRNDVNRIKMRSKRSEEDFERKAMRHNGPNHVYDLNQRGGPDGNELKTSHTQNGSTNKGGLNGVENQTFDVHDELEAYNIN